MPDAIELEVKGLDKLQKAFAKFPREITKNMEEAGKESANEILDTVGIRDYPPETAANRPPTPYYIRGRGTQYATRNLGNSENLGKKWTVKGQGFKTRIGNVASYGVYAHGDRRSDGIEQAQSLARIGWKKLVDIAKAKIAKITKIHQNWVNRTIRKLGL